VRRHDVQEERGHRNGAANRGGHDSSRRARLVGGSARARLAVRSCVRSASVPLTDARLGVAAGWMGLSISLRPTSTWEAAPKRNAAPSNKTAVQCSHLLARHSFRCAVVDPLLRCTPDRSDARGNPDQIDIRVLDDVKSTPALLLARLRGVGSSSTQVHRTPNCATRHARISSSLHALN
jgi:hypothetical protein